MEVIAYGDPASWEDRGMDWNVPDPRRADYVMAIRAALMERFAAAHVPLPSDVAGISPWKAVSVSQMAACAGAIRRVAGAYVRPDPDGTGFPVPWTYRDLVREEGCRVYGYANPGDLCAGGCEWLKAMKNALDRLTLVRCTGIGGRRFGRSGARHDPPFDESIGDAFAEAFGTGYAATSLDAVPDEVYAWSGNTHWKCPDPDDEESADGYCGYAESVAYEFSRVRSWAAGREFDFVAYALVAEPAGPAAFSDELATTVFDAGESGFVRGMNVVRRHVADPTDAGIRFGNADSIPRNEVVPTSDFDAEGEAVVRRSAKRGYVGKCRFFLDYGCANGFHFRPRED